MDMLFDEDWKELEQIAEILEPFKNHTKSMEGRRDSLAETIPTMELLLGKLEAAKTKWEGTAIGLSCNNAWNIFNKYYKFLDRSPVYIAAIVLDPRYKWAWFEKVWAEHPDWITEAKRNIKELWGEYNSKLRLLTNS